MARVVIYLRMSPPDMMIKDGGLFLGYGKNTTDYV
jgi:hypothetical protein